MVLDVIHGEKVGFGRLEFWDMQVEWRNTWNLIILPYQECNCIVLQNTRNTLHHFLEFVADVSHLHKDHQRTLSRFACMTTTFHYMPTCYHVDGRLDLSVLRWWLWLGLREPKRGPNHAVANNCGQCKYWLIEYYISYTDHSRPSKV